ncbi:tumor necrosis factor receptor superfamily member 10B-like isoform 1-T1 [Liasis olivaceus]
MAAKWLAVLTLLAEVESPPLQAYCDPGEYPYSGICCKYCPAGTHFEEYCDFPHTLGKCKSCTDGENYMDRENRLDHCLSCDECKSGFRMVKPCTTKNNTVCQCNDGYFRPQGCEECMKCKKRCPEGQVIVHSCNATMDMKCGLPYAGRNTDVFVAKTTPSTSKGAVSPSLEKESSTSLFMWLFIGLGFSPLVLIFGWNMYKWRKSSSVKEKEKEESKAHLIPGNNEHVNSTVSQSNLPETAERSNLELSNREENSFLPSTSSISPLCEIALSNEQSNVGNDVLRSNKLVVRIKNPFEGWEDICLLIMDMVGQTYWNTLMRKCGLSDNDIEKIFHDYPYINEQYHQMLKTLQDRNGTVDALNKILAGLQEMKLKGVYENLVNELKSRGIVTTVAED